MGLKSIANGQINQTNLPQNRTSSEYKPAGQSLPNYETAPLAADKQLGANLIANYNRARIEQKFFAPQQDEAKAKDDINGITTETVFEMPVSEGESQESVMRRAYEAIADKAGLSTEPDGGSKKVFVESRLKANTNEDDAITINNPGKNPAADYTDTEWADIRKLNFKPVSDEIKLLKELKSTDNFNAGTKAADDILRAMELGERGFFEKLTSGTDASTELAKALNKVKENGGGYDFQQGLLNRLGADKTVQLEKMLNGNRQYDSIVKDALSTSGLTRPDKQDRTGDVRREIAEKSSLDALVRLTSDKSYPMDKNFLIGAGNKVASKTTGLDRYSRVNEDGTTVFLESIKPQTAQVLDAVSKSPEASLELMQNKDFVKQAAYIGAVDDKNTTVSNIMRAATTGQLRESGNGQKIDNAIKNIAQVYAETDSITPDKNKQLTKTESSGKYINENTALALSEIYRNNSETFYEASQQKSSVMLDETSVDAIFKAMNQYESSKESALTTTKAKVAEILLRSTTENKPAIAKNAITLAKKFAAAEESVMLAQAKDADKSQERIADILGAATDVIGKTGGKIMGVEGVTFEILVKGVAAEVKRETKGNNVDTTQSIIKEKTRDDNAAKKIALLTAFESAANAKVNGDIAATKEEKEKAAQFLKDLRDFNEQLEDNGKILNANGRLINSANATERQLTRFQNAVNGKTDSSMKDQAKAQSVASRMADSMFLFGEAIGIDQQK